MKFTLPELPYAKNSLEPIISEKTIEFHYGKHHQAYVNNLNNLLEGSPFADASLEEIIKSAEGGLFNNAAQVWNHTFYFTQFAVAGNGNNQPKGALLQAINEAFSSFDNFKAEFVREGVATFGSGWVWFVKNAEGKLQIVKESNAGNPLTKGFTPLLTFDVWEHAYYLDYQNRRPDHLAALWDIVDWDVIEKRF